jgi:hypothetical protein
MKKKVKTKKTTGIKKKEVREKTSPKSAKKVASKKKVTIKPKTEAKKTVKKTVKKETKIRTKVKEKPKKSLKKIIPAKKKKLEKPEKKVPTMEEKSIKVGKKIAEIEDRIKKAVKKITADVEKKPVKIAEEIVTKIEEKVKKATKRIKAKIEERAPSKPLKIELPKIPESAKAKVKVIKKGKTTEVGKESSTPLYHELLPHEYGENIITLLIVDPFKLFAFWEITEDILLIYTGYLTLRVYDVSGIEFNGMNANSYFDIRVEERIGDWYIDASPEKEFIADIGVTDNQGTFITIARSNKVSTPRVVLAEEGELPQKLYDIGFRIGY